MSIFGTNRVKINFFSSLILTCRADLSAIPSSLILWQEIQELGRSFVNFEISHVRREANAAAHSLHAGLAIGGVVRGL